MEPTSAVVRDWVIVAAGILQVILFLGLLIALIIVYRKINGLINRGKRVVEEVENVVASPYYRAGAFLFRFLATGLGVCARKRDKEGKKHGKK